MVSFKVPVFFLALAAQALGQGQNGDVTCSTRYSTKSVKTVTTKTSTRYTTVTHTERVPKIQTITDDDNDHHLDQGLDEDCDEHLKQPAQSTTITSTFYETADGGTITVCPTQLWYRLLGQYMKPATLVTYTAAQVSDTPIGSPFRISILTDPKATPRMNAASGARRRAPAAWELSTYLGIGAIL
ncbi:unnamed protein product [Parascedosporium putredinis]|uniref:Uncharacterized protein n=1 Tax=Parascedosporium putredinis TaxID=1442378 RepID=A0A9P1MCD5_9PEZI|nr:unnamed protein product [Parascedosporium putredinis]CAI8000522.1 unnamed protein product [Parascedosporium putredinis]